jgi:hypothetical protein
VGIYFDSDVELAEGKNIFDFKVEDASNRIIDLQIVVYYINPVKRTDFRLRILPVVLPEYKIDSGDYKFSDLIVSPKLARKIHLSFPRALRSFARFKVIEQKFRLLSADLYFNKSGLSTIGKEVEESEAILAIRAYRTSPDELELSCRIIDVDDNVEILDNAQSYIKKLDEDEIQKGLRALADQIVKRFPIIEGDIVDIKKPDNILVLDFSKDKNNDIRTHMKLIVFSENKNHSGEVEVIGEARIDPILTRPTQRAGLTFEAHMLKSKFLQNSRSVRINDKVITK